jgi:hypothetical protein
MINPINFLMNRFGLKRTTSVVATTVVATTVVATALMYNAYKAYKAYKACNAHNKHRTLQHNHDDKEPPFENNYFKEYDEMEDDPDAPVPPIHIHVRETTPQGDVIMTYDAGRSIFCYYCDKRTVQFKYLEPVARKYVITHGCKRIYIDFREELTKAKDKAESATATAADKPTAAKSTATSSVFAQLKKYSTTRTTTPSPSNSNPIPPVFGDNNKLLKLNANVNANANANEDRACVLKEQVTRYLYCGRLDDFIESSSHATEIHDFNIIKPIDYASYKKMNDA